MPNIEIHGREMGDDLLGIIAYIIKNNFPEEVNDTVVTFADSKVFDLEGKERPYIRVIHTSSKKAEEMAIVFSKHFEVEVLTIESFFSISNEISVE
jgi:hypothetical protein